MREVFSGAVKKSITNIVRPLWSGPITAMAGWLSFYQYADQAVQLFLLMALSRSCSLVLLGQYLTLTAFWGWGTLMADFGLNPVLIKSSADQGIATAAFPRVLTIKIVLCAVILIFSMLWTALFGPFALHAVSLMVAVIWVRCMNNSLSAVLTGRNQAVPVAKYQLVTRLILAVLIWLYLNFQESVQFISMVHLIMESALMCRLWLLIQQLNRGHGHGSRAKDLENPLKVSLTTLFHLCTSHVKAAQDLQNHMELVKKALFVAAAGSLLFLVVRQPLFWFQYHAPEKAALYGLSVRIMDFLMIPVYSFMVAMFPQAVKNNGLFQCCRNKKDISTLCLAAFLTVTLILLLGILYASYPWMHVGYRISPKLVLLDGAVPHILLCTSLFALINIMVLDLFVQEKLALLLPPLLLVNLIPALLFMFAVYTGFSLSLKNALMIETMVFLSVLCITFFRVNARGDDG